jgi:hypothetical protein
VSATAREISGTIRYGRVLAAERGEDQTVLFDLDVKAYGIEGRPLKALPADISVKAADPVQGETSRGKWRVRLLASGGIEGDTIFLSKGGTSIAISPDPVVGVKVAKQ